MKLICLISFLSLFASPRLGAEVEPKKLSDYDRLIIASCLILEASSEGERGMQAVLNVISNRSVGDFSRMPCEVARQGQFTAMRKVWGQQRPDYGPLMQKAMNDKNFGMAVELVRQLERGELPDLTLGGTHYCKDSRNLPGWSQEMALTTQIGTHRFYRREPFSTQ